MFSVTAQVPGKDFQCDGVIGVLQIIVDNSESSDDFHLCPIPH